MDVRGRRGYESALITGDDRLDRLNKGAAPRRSGGGFSIRACRRRARLAPSATVSAPRVRPKPQHSTLRDLPHRYLDGRASLGRYAIGYRAEEQRARLLLSPGGASRAPARQRHDRSGAEGHGPGVAPWAGRRADRRLRPPAPRSRPEVLVNRELLDVKAFPRYDCHIGQSLLASGRSASRGLPEVDHAIATLDRPEE